MWKWNRKSEEDWEREENFVEEDSGREDRQDNGTGKFLGGLFCGVLLVLIGMGASLFHYHFRLNRMLTQIQKEEQNPGGELELDENRVRNKVGEIEELINQYYLTEVDSSQVEATLYNGMLAGLGDPYSVYYTSEELQTMEEATNGTYSGIGVTLTQNPETGAIYVVTCFEKTPAYEAGIQAGDVITGLGEETTDGMDLSELVSRIKIAGKDGVTLRLLRGEEEMELTLVSRQIDVPTVEGEMLEDGIGYLRILEFDTVTTEQFEEKLQELEDQGMEKLIVDVRDNPGGVLQVVCDILDQMLPEGLIVYTEDKYGEREEYFSDEEHSFDKPLAVLTNENSASASEIFAGAIKDYGLGTLVGKTTFGKGIVQRIFYLSDGTGVKLTVAKYYTPKGNDIHQKGIEPDVEAEMGDSVEDGEDLQLQEAVRVLKEGNAGKIF